MAEFSASVDQIRLPDGGTDLSATVTPAGRGASARTRTPQ
ncbi:MAG: hypothetical protein AVDCRST_MAG61-3161 [uncultured Friedmanniella sp.]|uniref:Uncharacterized protein n=1 Tax=uncultured Friedmanniella sp. TaxID=335381 RepID=A0A6J4LFL7_9ACTN|nr:MAG: hypothetical protein AVDCRST_MAG61-3161 [uncultured Friedmanniella sp.]